MAHGGAGFGASGAPTPGSFVGRSDTALPSPSVVLDLGRLRANCERMAARCAAQSVGLRPHVKTHKCLEAAALQCGGVGARGIVASTLAEAFFFARGGWGDITYGVPLEPSKLPELMALHARIPSLRVLVDSLDAVSAAASAVTALWAGEGCERRALSVWVKVDCGYHRAGVDPVADPDGAAAVVVAVAASGPHLHLCGLYSHSGNAYNTCSDCEPPPEQGRSEAAAAGARAVAGAEAAVLVAFAETLRDKHGVCVPLLSMGSTPSAVCAAAWPTPGAAASGDVQAGAAPWAVEVHPGNYPVLDRQQVESGAGAARDIAIHVLARVVGVYPARHEFLIDAGSCALHKDPAGMSDGAWGAVEGHEGLVLTRITQETAVVGRPDGSAFDMAPFRLGTVVRVVPNHACMTLAQHPHVYVVEETEGGDDGKRELRVVDVWTPVKFW